MPSHLWPRPPPVAPPPMSTGVPAHSEHTPEPGGRASPRPHPASPDGWTLGHSDVWTLGHLDGQGGPPAMGSPHVTSSHLCCCRDPPPPPVSHGDTPLDTPGVTWRPLRHLGPHLASTAVTWTPGGCVPPSLAPTGVTPGHLGVPPQVSPRHSGPPRPHFWGCSSSQGKGGGAGDRQTDNGRTVDGQWMDTDGH